MTEGLSHKQKVYIALMAIFILAVFLRCLMPLYLIKTHDNYRRLTDSSSYSWDMIAMSISLAKGEGFHLDYYSYALGLKDISTARLDTIKRKASGRVLFFDKGGLPPILISAGVTYLIGSFNVPAVQVVQGTIDSLGCFLVFGILCVYFRKRTGLIGALLYAICPTFIFFSYHLMSEAYVPVLTLGIGYMMILALNKNHWLWFALAGSFAGLLLACRSDNVLIVPAYLGCILWSFRRKMSYAIGRALVVCIFLFLTFNSFQELLPENIECKPTLGVALYNSLGEYPGNYKGLRFYYDRNAVEHGLKKVDEYLNSNDKIFDFMHSVCRYDIFSPRNESGAKYHLITLAYIREVIIEKPALYANRLINRFFVYLPAHPFLAYIAYFFDGINDSKAGTTRGYRYSNLFHLVKFVDWLCFVVFAYGLWICRRNKIMLSLLCIYFGVLVGHVLVGVGEISFRLDKEYVALYTRYLLGMAAIWPVFIAIGIEKIFGNLKFRYFQDK